MSTITITGIDLNKSALQTAACDTGRSRAGWNHGAFDAPNPAVSVDMISHFTREDERIDLCVLLDGYDPGPAMGSTQAEFYAPEARLGESSTNISGQQDACPVATEIREIAFLDSTI
jgi:hypothetical protein